MPNFIDRKEQSLADQLDELSKQAKQNQVLKILTMIRQDEFELLNSIDDFKEDEFVPLDKYIEQKNKIKAKVEYIEDLTERLKELCN